MGDHGGTLTHGPTAREFAPPSDAASDDAADDAATASRAKDARRRNDDAPELRARGVERARIPAREREGTRERATNGEAGRTRDDDDDDDARDTHARRGGEGVRGIRDIDGRRAG